MPFFSRYKDHPVIILLYILGAIASIVSLVLFFRPDIIPGETSNKTENKSKSLPLGAHIDTSDVWPGMLYARIEPNEVCTGTISPGQKNEYFFYVEGSHVYNLSLQTFDFNGQLKINYFRSDVIKKIVDVDGDKYVSTLFAPSSGTKYMITVSGQTKDSAGSYKIVAVQL
jgi:hypothetical protein